MNYFGILWVATACVFGTFWTSAWAQYRPVNTQKAGEHPPTPMEALEMISVPEGFEVSLFAGEPAVRQPIAMDFDDGGRLWVAEAYSYKEWKGKGEDRLLIFEDADGDGQFDKRTVFWDEGKHLSGFCLAGDGVWICDSPNLSFIPDRDRDDTPDGPPEVVLDGWTERAGHNFYNGLVWGPDGWLYGRHGITAPSLVGPPGAPAAERTFMDCSIWRWHPVMKRFELVVRGTTNPWGLDWDEHGEMFFSGNVNGHFWHAVPGSRYIRMHGKGHMPYTYERMLPCADHLHHEGKWTDRTNWRYGKANDLGGGHSHCGLVIYQGANFPAQWRGKAFLCNTHGNRMNMDRIEREGSGYAARHGKDFLLTKDRWFRGTAIVTGPDGAMYVSDWSDLGECHDNDGVHRTSGRIFKVWHSDGAMAGLSEDAQALDNEALAELLNHEDVWWRRKAHRILMERARAGADLKRLQGRWTSVALDEGRETTKRLRAMWVLHATGGCKRPMLVRLVKTTGDDHVRVWAIRLLCEEPTLDRPVINVMKVRAGTEPSLMVRQNFASALQRMPVAERGPVALALLGHGDVAGDRDHELMLWYGIEPLAADPEWVPKLLAANPSPRLDELVARRFAEAPGRDLSPLVDEVLSWDAKAAGTRARLAGVLAGLAASWKGRKDVAVPNEWDAFRKAVASVGDEKAALDLARVEGCFAQAPGADATAAFGVLADPALGAERRRIAVQAVVRSRSAERVPALLAQLRDEAIGGDVATALAGVRDARVPVGLVDSYGELPVATRARVLQTLASRVDWANALLDAVRRGRIPRGDLTSLHARQMATHRDRYLERKLNVVFGKVSKTSREKKKQIAAWEKKLNPKVLAAADRANGKAVYGRVCASCHRLFGEGGKLGPDLTGANRDSLYYLLENLIDPNAVVALDARLTTVTRTDGQVVAGMLLEETPARLVVGAIGAETVIPRAEVKAMERLSQSVMPEGLLDALSEADARDLIAFLKKK